MDWLVVGLGNPGDRYARTRHNVGFEVVSRAAERWGLPKPKKRYAGLFTDGRTGPGGPRVGVLLPQTFMNDAGRAVGPARGALGVDLDRVVVVHDEIDLPFGTVQSRLGGGLAGHNGLKSVKRGLGGDRVPPRPRRGWPAGHDRPGNRVRACARPLLRAIGRGARAHRARRRRTRPHRGGMSNVELLRSVLVNAYADPEAYFDLLDPDVEWDVRDTVSPEAGVYHGPEDVRALYRRWASAFSDWSFEVDRLIDAGDSVVAFVTEHGHGRGSGVEVEMRRANVTTFRDGRIVRFRSFSSREAALEFAGLEADGSQH